MAEYSEIRMWRKLMNLLNKPVLIFQTQLEPKQKPSYSQRPNVMLSVPVEFKEGMEAGKEISQQSCLLLSPKFASFQELISVGNRLGK